MSLANRTDVYESVCHWPIVPTCMGEGVIGQMGRRVPGGPMGSVNLGLADTKWGVSIERERETNCIPNSSLERIGIVLVDVLHLFVRELGEAAGEMDRRAGVLDLGHHRVVGALPTPPIPRNDRLDPSLKVLVQPQ